MIDREQIIAMAREAGCTTNEAGAWAMFLERFASLVASAERERIIMANAPEIEKVNAALNRLTEENTKLWGWYHDLEQQFAILQRRTRGETK